MRIKKNKKQYIAGFCARLGTFLLVLTIAVCIPLSLPRLLGYQVYAVISGSMEPAVSIGSLVYVRQIPPETVQKDAIIAFYGTVDSSAVILHRVVENRTVDGSLITKGDANAQPDLSPVRYDRVLGKAEGSIPCLGRLAFMLSGTWGKLSSLGLVLAAVLLHAVGAALGAKEERFQNKG